MPERRLTAEPPVITEEGFEYSLATDSFLVDYFNEFLSLPTFPEAIRFNADYSVFEVVNDAPQLLEKQLKRILYTHQPRNPIYDVVRKGICDGKSFQKKASSEAETVNVNYSIMCLSQEEGIEWVKKKRLPAFLESDCYFEYRLAKLISQVRWSGTGMNVTVATDFTPWLQKKPPTPPPSVVEDEDILIMKKFYVSMGQASYTQTKDWFTLAKQSQQTVATFSLPPYVCYNKIEAPAPTITSVSESAIFDNRTHSWVKKTMSNIENTLSDLEEEIGSMCLQDTTSQALLRIYLDSQRDVEENVTLHFENCEEFLKSYILYILKESVYQITGPPHQEHSNYVNFNNVSQVVVEECYKPQHQDLAPGETAETPPQKSEEIVEKESLRSESLASESRANWCVTHGTYDIGNRKEFERFKKFIQGTLGEKYLWLWMDIERLKALKHHDRHQRHLEKMKKLYLVSSGDRYLSMEILTKFKLLDGSQWNEEHLTDIQVEVVKALLLYWAPRFCITHSRATKIASAQLKFWHIRQQKPRKDVDPFPQMPTLLPLRPKSCFPRIAEMQEQPSAVQPPRSPRKSFVPRIGTRKAWKSETSYQPRMSMDDTIDGESRYTTEQSRVFHLTSFTDISECLKPQLERRLTYTEENVAKTLVEDALGGFNMESLLQSLYVETRAGFFFTKFCEDTGNKLWKNSVYFWFDLQAYHQLFYQETLQPFKICKQAQYLFATYVAPSAPFDIRLRKEKRREIYMQMQPPFEDLFDAAEEYILLLLLEPWTMMINSDLDDYRKVKLVQGTRQLDSMYFRKLQALHKKTVFKQTEDTAEDFEHGILQFPSINKQTEYWNHVPEEFKYFTFNDLLSNKLEFEHFHQFLETHYSSMDLMCWMDIEQFRRIPYIDREQREAKSISIRNKYLNKKYFFGPNSPASLYHQNQIMQLSDDWGRVLHEHLDTSVFEEMQKHVLKKLENVWLPLFLASGQFMARQKIKMQMQDIAEELLLQKRERKIGVWKPVESKWISSSGEIIAFRKTLLNPVTAKQFQRFVALKGDLLENGVRFWQEVQKYKDLCHSHCDENTIQKKTTMIINCFINSSIPPALQIDIPQEQAHKIIEHRKELGPYIFREAQMTIFGVLFKFWPQFCEFRKNLTDENILSALEKRQTLKQKKKSVLEDEKFSKEITRQHISISGIALKTAPLTSDTTLGLSAYGRQPTWCYSKYIEALEQEKLLLKIQEELEKKMFPE
ncbi:regulator of G-protein signaling 22 [Sorex araneus]|uniref:regulator of G-protein signaling 22 n=1 Tax=Sorex araneus TaxID=42254 RepID=UPI00243342CE|nr:regulator of G-protein signaling 22 [Sorex araneus]